MSNSKKIKLVNRQQIATSIDIRLVNTMNKLSEQTRIPKSKLFDEALELLFAKHGIEIEEVTE